MNNNNKGSGGQKVRRSLCIIFWKHIENIVSWASPLYLASSFASFLYL